MSEVAQLVAGGTPAGLAVWLCLRDPVRTSTALAGLIAAITKNSGRRRGALRFVQLVSETRDDPK